MSNRDNLVIADVVGTLSFLVVSIFAFGTARWTAAFFERSRLAELSFVETSLIGAGVAGLGTGLTSATVACGHRSANSNTLGGETIVGKLVSIITRSGNRSADAILMAGLSVTPPGGSGGSDGGCGKHHPDPISNRTKALPTNPKYLINGMGSPPVRDDPETGFLRRSLKVD
jgi:hypothetical protein